MELKFILEVDSVSEIQEILGDISKDTRVDKDCKNIFIILEEYGLKLIGV